MEEKSMTRNHERGIIGRGIIEKESSRRHRGGELMEKQSLRRGHGGIIWGASGNGSHLGAFERLEAEEASRRHLEVSSQKSQHLSAKMQKLHLNFNFTTRF
jgi:hypothetical protein